MNNWKVRYTSNSITTSKEEPPIAVSSYSATIGCRYVTMVTIIIVTTVTTPPPNTYRRFRTDAMLAVRWENIMV